MLVIFFDIGDTLATPIFSTDDQLIKFNVFPEVMPVLEALKTDGYQMGVISNAGNLPRDSVNQALKDCKLYSFFNPQYIFYRKKDSPKVFNDIADEACIKTDQCVFVGENSIERSFALEGGFLRVASHPLLVKDVIDGIALIYLRVSLNSENETRWAELIPSLNFVPLKVSGENNKTIYGIVSLRTLDKLGNENFEIEVLGKRDAPLETDLYLVRDDRSLPEGFADTTSFSLNYLAEEGKENLVVGTSDEGLYLAIPSNESIGEIHFPDSLHGHNEKLLADLSLFRLIDSNELKKKEFLNFDFTSFFTEENFQFSVEEMTELEKIETNKIRQFHQPYAGLAPITNNYRLNSRHVRHNDNRLVVETLQNDLKRIGGNQIQVSKHRFQHGNLFLYNVIAEYPGVKANEIVIVSAHLDSTAASDGGAYNSATDPAPGADDDASGMAAILVMVEILGNLYRVKKFQKTVRFVLFNAEEEGLVGSKTYARSQAAIQAQIVAVLQMDMIGYRGNQPATSRRFEVHAGYKVSKSVEDRSLELAALINKIYQTVSPNLVSQQVYPDYDSGDGNDPASGRSDHAPFQERAYPAVVISEDFFAGPKHNSPEAQPNPNYHKNSDRQIDYEYAADIARVIAGTIVKIANM